MANRPQYETSREEKWRKESESVSAAKEMARRMRTCSYLRKSIIGRNENWRLANVKRRGENTERRERRRLSLIGGKLGENLAAAKWLCSLMRKLKTLWRRGANVAEEKLLAAFGGYRWYYLRQRDGCIGVASSLVMKTGIWKIVAIFGAAAAWQATCRKKREESGASAPAHGRKSKI